MPIVATNTMTRGASKSRRMTVTSNSAPYNVPTASAASTASQYGTWYCSVNSARSPAPTRPMPPTAKLMTRVARYTSTMPSASIPNTRPDRNPLAMS